MKIIVFKNISNQAKDCLQIETNIPIIRRKLVKSIGFCYFFPGIFIIFYIAQIK